MKQRNAGRPSFTLIEILIVVGIITVLFAIAVGAYYRTAQVAQRKATESFLSTLDSAYKKAKSKILRDCRVGAIPANIQAMAVNPGEDSKTQNDRAMVLYEKFKMRQEFPMTFYEALNPSPLPAKQTYVDKLGKAGVTAATVGPNDPVGPWESAILFEMALDEARGGITQISSTLGASATVDCPYVDPNHPTWNLKALKALVDPYGQPIFYYRWAGNFVDYQVASVQAHNDDSGDQEGLLSDPTWVASANGQTFVETCHWVAGGQSLNQSHLIVSAGLNGLVGFPPGTAADQSSGIVITAGSVNPMAGPPSTPITGDADNVYSSRVGAPGN